MDEQDIKHAQQRIYHLEGPSHDAANQLYQRKFKLQDLPKLTKEDITQIKEDLDLQAVITVDYNHDDFPRAYRTTPSIAVIHMNNREPDFYMLAPVGYNGQVSNPVGSKLLEGKEERVASNGLFLGGHSSPIFVIYGLKNGTDLPEDYSKEQSLHSLSNGKFMSNFNFFARKQNPSLLESGFLLFGDLLRAFSSASANSSIRPMIVEGQPYLAVSKDVPAHTPLGYMPVSHQLFVWKHQDEFDRAIGIAPPPMPLPLEEECKKLRDLNGGQVCNPS